MLTGIILTRNEEKNIFRCIESILFCDEIIVVDDYSTDKTETLIKKIKNEKIKVYQRKLDSNFANQRNFGLEKAQGEWVLFIDADEVVSDALAFEIMQAISLPNPRINGYFIKRHDTLWGKELKYGETGGTKLLRLAKKEAGQWKGKVHEVWTITGETGTLNNDLHHYPHQTIKEFLAEINFYTTLRAEELYEKNVNVNTFFIILYPKAKFFINYFFKQGFRDGTAGLIVAILMSLHSFLVRGKLWLLWQKKHEKK